MFASFSHFVLKTLLLIFFRISDAFRCRIFDDLEGPLAPLEGPLAPLEGPQGPSEGPPGSFGGPWTPLVDPRAPLEDPRAPLETLGSLWSQKLMTGWKEPHQQKSVAVTVRTVRSVLCTFLVWHMDLWSYCHQPKGPAGPPEGPGAH